MGKCAVRSCNSNTRKGIRVFKFPSKLRNAERRKIWEEYADRDDLPEHATMCELHFSDEQFELNRQDARKLLKWNAIPDIVYVLKLEPNEKIQRVFEVEEEEENEEVIEKIQVILDEDGDIKLDEDNIDKMKVKKKSRQKRKRNGLKEDVDEDGDTNKKQILDRHSPEKTKIENGDEESEGETKVQINFSEKTPADFCFVSVTEGHVPPDNKTRSKENRNYRVIKLNKGENALPIEINRGENLELLKVKEELRLAHRKIETLENLVSSLQNQYKKTFNSDQTKFLINGKGQGLTWCDDTLNKAVRLYMACGPIGYEEILMQNLPYPSSKTLQCKRGELMKMLNVKMTEK